MNSLTQYTGLLNRFPAFELSYETVHKKVSHVIGNSIALAIPVGRKYYIWYSYEENSDKDACYLLGLDKDKQICSVESRPVAGTFPKGYALGTVVYGTMVELTPESSIFVAEDIYLFRGIPLHNLCFGNRLGYLREFVTENPDCALPIMWHVGSGGQFNWEIPADLAKKMAYTAHHVQYRNIDQVAPYVNVPIPKRGVTPVLNASVSSAEVAQKLTAAIEKPVPRFDYGKPAYRYPAVFNVTADPQLDLYHLYAYGGKQDTAEGVYCGLAGVQSYKTSVFMNRLFRRIRENENLDLAEESEDEADFENMDTNKFVYLDRVIPVECVFNQKHRKWIPMCLAKKEDKVVHIEKLVLQNGSGCRVDQERAGAKGACGSQKGHRRDPTFYPKAPAAGEESKRPYGKNVERGNYQVRNDKIRFNNHHAERGNKLNPNNRQI